MYSRRADSRRIWRRFGVIGLLALTGAGVAPSRGSAGAAMLAEPVHARRDRAADLVWGNNQKGPYTLSRRMIIPGSEVVYLNGARAFRLSDYQIDYTAGTITFQSALPSGQVARVEYAFDPRNSRPNLQPLKAPLSLDLAELQMGSLMSTTLRFNGVWRTPAQGQPEVTALGMGAEGKLGAHARFASLVAFTPRSAREGQTSNDLNAAAVQLSGQIDYQGLQARANYARTGRAFAAAKDYGLKQGTQLFDLSTAYKFNQHLVARSSLQRNEELAASGGPGRTSTTVAHDVTARLSPASQVTLARRSQQVSVSDKPDQSTVTDRVQLDQQLGKLATAQVRHEVTTAGQGEASQSVATTGLRVDAKPTTSTRVTAERVEKRVQDQDAVVSTRVGVTTGTQGSLRLEGRYAQTDAPGRDPEVSKQVGVTAGAPGGLKLEGRFLQTEAPGRDAEEVRAARVEATPVEGLKIGGGVTQKQTGSAEVVAKDAMVELRPHANLHLVGRLNQQEDGSGQVTHLVRGVDARLRPLEILELSGAYKERLQRQEAGPFTRALTVSLKPARFFQLSGSFIENPEERGQVREEQRRTLGLRSDMGQVSLTGRYAQHLSPAAALAEELEVGLAVQISKYDRLFSSYKLAERIGANALSTTHYRFGYTRLIGGAFGLSLEAEYLHHMQGDRILRERNEARARVGVNARF